MSAVALATIVACSSPPPGRDPPIDSGGPTSSTSAETGTHAVGLSAVCSPTEDALRRSCAVHADPPAAVRIRVERAAGAGTPRSFDSPLAADHVIPVVFLAPDTDYDFVVEVVGDEARTVSGTFRTDPLPDGLDTRLDVTGTASAPLVGVNFPCAPNAVAVVYDTATGEPVWMHDLDPTGRFGFEHVVRFTPEHTVIGDSGERIVEVGLDGRVALELIAGVDYDELVHHDLFATPDRLYALHRIDGAVVLDGVLVFDRRTGARVAAWDPRDHLEIPADATGEWMHLNALAVGSDGALVLSSYVQNSILAVEGDPADPAFGEVRWALAGDAPAGFGQDFAVDWSAVDGDDAFSEPHAVTWSDGTLGLLDNGHGRGLALTVDPLAGAASVDAAFATEAAECGPQGTFALTSTGRAWVGCAGDRVRELRPTGEVAWEGAVVCPGPSASAVRFYPLEGW